VIKLNLVPGNEIHIKRYTKFAVDLTGALNYHVITIYYIVYGDIYGQGIIIIGENAG
jgi:hypothetical protein